MEYAVVNVINSYFDCASHESGVCMCNTGDDTPWLWCVGNTFEDKNEALKFAKQFCDSKFEELKEEQDLNDGWYFLQQHNVIFICKDLGDDVLKDYWVFKVDVIEIKE